VFYIAPGVFTALFYIQQNNLHMNTEAQGFLQLLNGAFGMLAALLYGGVLCRRFTLRTLLMACMVLGAIGNLAYWFYATPMQARVAEKYLGIWLHDGRGLNNARDGARHAARQRGAGIFGAHVGA